MSVFTVKKFKLASNAARKVYNSIRIHDQESLVIGSAIAAFSVMAAYNLHQQGEKAVNVNVEAEVGVREDKGSQSLHFTVDHNNFLPCVTVSDGVSGQRNTVEYKPIIMAALAVSMNLFSKTEQAISRMKPSSLQMFAATTMALTSFSIIHSFQVTQNVDKDIVAGSKQIDAVCPCAIKVVKLT